MLNKFTKYTLITSIIIWFFSVCCFVTAQGNNDVRGDFAFPFEQQNQSQWIEVDTTNLWDIVDLQDDSIINRLLWVFWLNDDALWWNHKFIVYVKGILNIALSLLSMIALIITIYTFYMMFFSDNDAWIKKAKERLVGIFIALAIIGLAWLIVSFIFRWYQSNWQSAFGTSAT